MILTQKQLIELQEGLRRAGHPCPSSGMLTPSTREAFRGYYISRKETVPNINELTSVPVFEKK